MLWKKTFHFLLVLIFTFSGCRKSETFQLNETIEVSFWQSAVVHTPNDPIDIKFNRLIEDSRCTHGRVCVWAGRLTAEFVIDNHEKVKLSLGDLNTAALQPKVRSMTYKGHTIELKEADFGALKNQNDEKHYTFYLTVN